MADRIPGQPQARCGEHQLSTKRSLLALIVIGTAATLISAGLETHPWLPQVNITSEEEHAEYSGFVIHESRMEFTIVHEDPRMITIVPISGTEQKLCDPAASLGESLLQLLIPSPYEECLAEEHHE